MDNDDKNTIFFCLVKNEIALWLFAYVINNLSDKLIEQYEKRIAEKDAFIELLQKTIEQLRK